MSGPTRKQRKSPIVNPAAGVMAQAALTSATWASPGVIGMRSVVVWTLPQQRRSLWRHVFSQIHQTSTDAKVGDAP